MLGAVGAGARHQVLSQAFPRTPAHSEGQRPAEPRLARPPPHPLSPCLAPLCLEGWAGRSPPPRSMVPDSPPGAPSRHLPRPQHRAALGLGGGPKPQKGSASAGGAGRGGLGGFACLWLPHPPRPAPEFLCKFQTQRLRARAALDSVPKAPRQGGGGDPEDPRALAPVGSQGRLAPAARWGNQLPPRAPGPQSPDFTPNCHCIGAYLVTSSGLSVLYSRNKFMYLVPLFMTVLRLSKPRP